MLVAKRDPFERLGIGPVQATVVQCIQYWPELVLRATPVTVEYCYYS